MSATPPPHLYRLTRPDGLGFFRRHSAAQFGLGCAGLGLALLGYVLRDAGVGPRIALGVLGVGVLLLGIGRTPSGEDALDLVGPAARFAWRQVRRRDEWAAPLIELAELPPLFAGIELLEVDIDRERGRAGLVVDRADGVISMVLRVHGEGFMLADPNEQDGRVRAFGSALASLGRETSPIVRVAWSQFSAALPLDGHLAYLESAKREIPDPEMHDAYLEVLADSGQQARQSEVLVTITASLARIRTPRPLAIESRATRRSSGRRGSSRGGVDDRILTGARQLFEESGLLAGELANAGLVSTGPLPVGQIARALRERLDPAIRHQLARRERSLADTIGLVAAANAFPLLVEEHPRSVRTDQTTHRVLRVAEWPRSEVRADWLASMLSASDATRSFTVIFAPQSRRLARRQALAVATRVGANIDERSSKGRRVGAEERRAQLAAEALDEELEAGAEMELILGLVDVTGSSEFELERACDQTVAVAADAGIELRSVELRQGEALVASLPLGRGVLGRAR